MGNTGPPGCWRLKTRAHANSPKHRFVAATASGRYLWVVLASTRLPPPAPRFITLRTTATRALRCGGALLALWLACATGPLRAQPDPRALRRQLAQARTDTARARLLGELGERVGEENPDSGLHLLRQSLRLAQRARHAAGEARALCQLGHACVYLLRDEALALEYLNRAQDVAGRTRDFRHLALSYQLLSVVAQHQRMGDPLELLATAQRYARQANDWEVLCNGYEIGYDFHALRGNYQKAENHCRLSMAASAPHNLDRWLTSGLDCCTALEKRGKNAEALALARQLAAAKDRLRQTQGPFVYANDMAQLSIKLKRYAEAENYLLRGLALERQRPRPDSLHLVYYYRNLVSLYAEQRDFENAYRWGNALADARLGLQRVRQTRDAKLRMTELQAALAVGKKEAELARLAARQQRQRAYLVGALLLAGLLVGFVVVLQRKQRRIERQRAQLARLNATKDKLFAVLAHDLRSPVAGLANRLSLMEWGALSPGEFAEALPAVEHQLHALQLTLDNLLNWVASQMDGLRPRPAAVPLRDAVARETAALQPTADAKRIALTNRVPATARLLADPDHLAIVVRNLLQNALKFTHPGGTVCFTYAPEDHHGRLDVTDNGVGITPEHLATLFEWTGRPSRAGTAREPGAGLGLVLIHELVRLNGGRLHVASEVNQGTTASVAFPLAPADAEAVQNGPAGRARA